MRRGRGMRVKVKWRSDMKEVMVRRCAIMQNLHKGSNHNDQLYVVVPDHKFLQPLIPPLSLMQHDKIHHLPTMARLIPIEWVLYDLLCLGRGVRTVQEQNERLLDQVERGELDRRVRRRLRDGGMKGRDRSERVVGRWGGWVLQR